MSSGSHSIYGRYTQEIKSTPSWARHRYEWLKQKNWKLYNFDKYIPLIDVLIYFPRNSTPALKSKFHENLPMLWYQHVPSVQFSSVQSLSRVWLFATPWITARQASLSLTNSWSSLKLTSIESVMPSSHLILCRPLLLLPPIPPSIRVFSNESTLHIRWPTYWSFSFSIIPSKEHSGLISFRMDWLDLLAVQGTLKSLLQYHSSKASTLQRSAFFTVQLAVTKNQTKAFWESGSKSYIFAHYYLQGPYSPICTPILTNFRAH